MNDLVEIESIRITSAEHDFIFASVLRGGRSSAIEFLQRQYNLSWFHAISIVNAITE